METYGLEKLGIINAGAVYRNLTPAQLVEHALRRGEGTLSNTGALVVKTGKYTGRSANDKFIVDTPAVHDDIAWGKVNRPMDKARFDAIYAKVTAYLQNKDVFIFDGFAGADPKYTKGFRIVNELASQNLFIHQLLRRPTADQLKDYLLNGNVKNSVNLPNVAQEWSGISRVCLIHQNIPAMLTKITSILSAEGVNVENLTNKSKKDYAYTMVDLNSRIKDKVAEELRAIPGMIRVRVLNH